MPSIVKISWAFLDDLHGYAKIGDKDNKATKWKE